MTLRNIMLPPSLDKKISETPRLAAQLRMLLLLADAIRSQLSQLYKRAGPGEGLEWHDILGEFARELPEELISAREPGRALRTWERFEDRSFLDSVSKPVRSVLARIREEIRARLASGDDPLFLVQAANEEAYRRMASILSAQGLAHLVLPRPAEVFIAADLDGQFTCATSSSSLERITFYFQRQAHALWGALILPYIFQHEYLSHLFPRCRYLTKEVREGWLMRTLIEEIHQEPSSVPAAVDSFLIRQFRTELMFFLRLKAQYKAAQGISSSPGIEEGATRIRAKSLRFFWNLNGDILQVDHGLNTARQITGLLHRLSFMADQDLEKIIGTPAWPGLPTLIEQSTSTAQSRRGQP